MTTTTAVNSNLAPVQLLGLGTNLDVNSIVNAIEQEEQIPLTALQTEVTSNQTELSAYGSLSSQLATFQSSLSSLEDGSSFANESATVGDTSVANATVSNSAGQNVPVGTHSLSVSQLAQSQLVATSDFSSSTATVGTGTISIQLGAWNSTNTAFTPNSSSGATTITISAGNNSLQGVANAINAANAGVTASIVNDGTGARLVLTSSTTGANNGFEVSVNDSDGNNTDASGLSALAYNPAASGGTPQTTLLQSAQNANLTIDGVAISSATNTVSNALQGVTLNLTGTTSTPTTLQISQDTSAANSAIQGFVAQYNALVSTIAGLTANTPGGTNGPLAADPSVAVITTDLQNIVASVFNNTGSSSIQSLNDLGIAFQEDGTLTLDQSTLNSALASNPSAVAQLFSNTGTASDALVDYTGATSATQPGSYGLNITQLATQGSYNGSAAANLTITQGSNDTFAATIDGVSANVTVPAGTYASAAALATAVQAAINGTAAFSQAGITVNVAAQSNGALNVTTADYGSTAAISFDSGAGAQGLFGTAPTATAGTDVAGSLGGYSFTGSGQTITANPNSPAAGLTLTVEGGTTGYRGTVNYSTGIASQLDAAVTQFLDPTNGIIATATNSLNTTISNLQSQESDLEANLQTEQQTLISEYTAMTQLVDSLSQTSNYLSEAFGASNSGNSILGNSSNSGSSSSSNSSSGTSSTSSTTA
jgi:flagellar hook-associated protein 2